MGLRDAWKNVQTKKLIQSYKKYPILWDSNCKDYKNKSARMKCLKSIVAEVSQVKPRTTINDIRAKLNTLRAQFGKEKHKRNNALEKGMAYKPKLWCYEDLKFIDIKVKAKVSQNEGMETVSTTNDEDRLNRLNSKKFKQPRIPKFPTWSKKQMLTLIQHLKNYPLLYDQSHPLYSQPIHRTLCAHKLLSEIKSCKPDATIAEMKSKINTLRGQRQKEKRKQEASIDHTGRVRYVPKLWSFKHLMFLDEKRQYSKQEPEEFQVGEEPDDCYVEENENEIYVKSFDDSDVEDTQMNPSPEPQLLADAETNEKMPRSILHKKCLNLVESLTKQMLDKQQYTRQYDDYSPTPQATLAKMVELELLKVSDKIFQDTKWKIIKLLEEASRRHNATSMHM